MPATYEPIATTTLSSAGTSITFSSIPSTYTDLVLIFIPVPAVTTNAYIRFNGDTATNYSNTDLIGTGSVAASARNTSQTSVRLDYSAFNTLRFFKVNVFSYAGSTNKTFLSEGSGDNNGSGWVINKVGLWRNTAAINQVEVFAFATNDFAAGTTATLYGIKAA